MDTGLRPETRVSIVTEPATVADRELVSAVLRKDRKATAEFVSRYADRVYRYVCSRIFPRTDSVDDIFQEVFLAAWEHLRGFRGDSSLEAWLLGIARHKVEDYYRSRLREADPLDETNEQVSSGAGEPELNAELDVRKLQDRVEATLDGLPEVYALVLVWRYWEKRSAREMAAMTGRTEKAIERLLARARTLFRERWNNCG